MFTSNLPALSFSLWAQLAVIRFPVLNDTIPQDSDRLMGYGILMSWQSCLSLLFSHKTQAGVWWDQGFGPCHSGEWMTRHLGPILRLPVTDVSRFMWQMLEVNVNNIENNWSCAETSLTLRNYSLLTQTLYHILPNVESSQWFCEMCCFASRPMDAFPWYFVRQSSWLTIVGLHGAPQIIVWHFNKNPIDSVREHNWLHH